MTTMLPLQDGSFVVFLYLNDNEFTQMIKYVNNFLRSGVLKLL
jgi:hypothetical protein